MSLTTNLSSTAFLQLASGGNREIKKAVEAYWAQKIPVDQLNKVASDVKKTNWTSMNSMGVNFIPRYLRMLARG